MRLHGVLVGVDNVEDKFDENEGEFYYAVTPDTGGTTGIDLLADTTKKDFLEKPELLPLGAKINYCS